MPNVDGLSPGQKTEMYSFDHDLGSFVSIGPATVSEDGTVIQSDPGVGVVKGGWHCGGNPSAGGSSGSLKVSLSPNPVKLQYGKATSVSANGSPPLDAEYLNWTIKNKSFDPTLEFNGQPSCPDQPTCSNTLDTKRLEFDTSGSGGGRTDPTEPFQQTRAKICGTAEIDVTFKCTTTGQTVTDTALVEVGCGNKSAAECEVFCSDPVWQANCGTPCEFLNSIPHQPFVLGGQCWKKKIGNKEICYYDFFKIGGRGSGFACCPNRCFGDSFSQWPGAGDIVSFDSKLECTLQDDCTKVEKNGVRCDDVDVPGGDGIFP